MDINSYNYSKNTLPANAPSPSFNNIYKPPKPRDTRIGLRLSSLNNGLDKIPDLQNKLDFPELNKPIHNADILFTEGTFASRVVQSNCVITKRYIANIKPGWVRLSKDEHGHSYQDHGEHLPSSDYINELRTNEKNKPMYHLAEVLDRHNKLYEETDECQYSKTADNYGNYDEEYDEEYDVLNERELSIDEDN